jgi:hypothetical protein
MKSHIITIRNSRSYGINFPREPNNIKVLTRAPMFGMDMALNNDTSSSSNKVLCC